MAIEMAKKIHRTWTQLLIESGYREAAAIAVDCGIDFEWNYEYASKIYVEVPPNAIRFIRTNSELRKIFEQSLFVVLRGYVLPPSIDEPEDTEFSYRIKLIEPEENWQQIVRDLIVNSEHPNQGIVTEKAFAKRGKEPFTYNEMKFASQTEIRIAQELEAKSILFFPLPLAVRAETGNLFSDHREVDFLICKDGTWGILEVSYHPNRYEKDAEKDAWFKKSGILCIQHYSAERCYQFPSEVVNEFLSILHQHKR